MSFSALEALYIRKEYRLFLSEKEWVCNYIYDTFFIACLVLMRFILVCIIGRIYRKSNCCDLSL